MPLDASYLQYPQRSYGMDQDRYAWRTLDDRPPIAWPQARSVAATIVVPIEHHGLVPASKPFKHPGAMVTPYPDLRHYTSRDYGNRVCAFRLLDRLAAHGLKATFPINAMALERLKPLVDAIRDGGHEIAAHGLGTDHIHWQGLDRAIEDAWVAEVRQRFDAIGLRPRVWLSPARQQSFATLDLLAEHGFDVCLDWEQDSVPLAMKTAAGKVWAVPLSNELDDRLLLIDRRQTEDEWAAQIMAAVGYLKSEAPRLGGQSLGFTLTPYVAAQPFRIAAVDRLLAALAGDQAVWNAGVSDVVKAVEAPA